MDQWLIKGHVFEILVRDTVTTRPNAWVSVIKERVKVIFEDLKLNRKYRSLVLLLVNILC